MPKISRFYRCHVKFQRMAFRGKSQSKWFLASLLLLLLIPFPMLLFPNGKQLVFEVVLTLVVFFGVQLISDTLRHFTIGMALGCSSIALIWLEFFQELPFMVKVLKPVAICTFLIYLSYYLFNFVGTKKVVDANMILVSISGYLLIGLFGGQLFYVLYLTMPESFSGTAEKPLFTLTYYSFTTLTSLGFGDILPQTQAAQSLSLMVALAGELYITILVGIIVGKYLMQKQA